MVLLVEGRDLASDHEPNDGVGADLRLVERAHECAVAQHSNPVAERIHLVHAVRDIDDSEAFGAQLADQGEQSLALASRERRRWLVHDQYLRPRVQRAGNLHELALAHRQMGDKARR